MNRSLRTSPVTRTKLCAATQPPTRHIRLSAAISPQSTAKAFHTPCAPGPREITSISPFSPYWVQTEQTTARNTVTRTAICPARCRLT